MESAAAAPLAVGAAAAAAALPTRCRLLAGGGIKMAGYYWQVQRSSASASMPSSRSAAAPKIPNMVYVQYVRILDNAMQSFSYHSVDQNFYHLFYLMILQLLLDNWLIV